MKHGFYLVLAGTAILAFNSAAAETNNVFTDEREKASYAAGVQYGVYLKRQGMDVDVNVLSSAIREVLEGKEPKLNETEVRTVLISYAQAARKKMGEVNRKAGEEWLAANKGKPGVKTHTVTLPDGTTSELQYKVITEGTGATPKSNDVVKVHYKGTLINGKEFDSSFKRGQPASFPANRVIKGWTEALQMMKVGAKYELYIPAALAYGDQGSGQIEPGSTLIFGVELLDIEAPQPPPPAPAATTQPLTSDIIRVPSAEELKKGAKIEVIKPEDVEKYQKAEQEKAAKEKAAKEKANQ